MEKKNGSSDEVLFSNFLGCLNDAEKKLVEQNATFIELDKHEAIYKEGADSDRIYFVKRGRVKIVTNGEDDKEVLKSLVLEGELLGEGAIFGDGIPLAKAE